MQLTCSDWQEGLVHFVDAHVVDLVDAHNVAIASQQRQHPQGCPWQQAPIQCLEQTSSVPNYTCTGCMATAACKALEEGCHTA